MKAKQRGVACIGCLVGAVIVIGLALGGVRIIKAYIQNSEIKHVLQTLAQDVELQSASENQVRIAYAKHASVADITALQPDDIQISNERGQLQLYADYSVEIPVAGNINIVLQFTPNSNKQ